MCTVCLCVCVCLCSCVFPLLLIHYLGGKELDVRCKLNVLPLFSSVVHISLLEVVIWTKKACLCIQERLIMTKTQTSMFVSMSH